MRGVLRKTPQSFGLVRLAFGFRGLTRTMFVFVSVADVATSKFSTLECSRDVAGAMEGAIGRFSAYTAQVCIRDQKDCTVEFLVGKLCSALDSGLFSMSSYSYCNSTLPGSAKQGGARHAHFEMEAIEEEDDDEHDGVCRSGPTHDQAAVVAVSLQRKKVKAYRVGDLVEIWSLKYKKWIQDAEVVDVVKEKVLRDGIHCRAGSVKVLYSSGSRFKWVPPQLIETDLRASPRSRAPAAMCGKLQKECHSNVTEWCPMHVEINRGYLQWWESEEQAVNGCKSQGHTYLLGLQLRRQDRSFKLRIESASGAVFAFRASTEEDACRWIGGIWEHAAHCREVQKLEVPTRRAAWGGA